MKRAVANGVRRFYDFGEFRLDPVRYRLFRGDEVVSVSPKAIETLTLLVRNPGKLIEREALMHALWPDTIVEDANLTVAISQLRRTPYLLEQPTAESAKRALSRLTSEQSSPASIESGVLASQVLDRLSQRERMIAIWKRSGFSSREIAEKLEMSVPAVDTTFCRVRQKVQKLLGPGAKLGG